LDWGTGSGGWPPKVTLETWQVVTGLLFLFAYPLYILVMAGVLRVCGVAKQDISKWALRQAGRQRFADLIRAARGLPDEKPNELPGAPAPSPQGNDDGPAA
jgi:hypothetical protein